MTPAAGSEDELQEYLNQKGVKHFLQELVQDLVNQKPHEPVRHIFNYIRYNYSDQLSSPDVDQLATELEQLLSRSPATADYSLDDDDDEEETNHQDVVAPEPPPPPQPQKEAPKGRNRRKSVCAEQVAPEDLDTMEAKVYPKSDEVKQRLSEYIKNSILFAGLDQKQKNIILDAMFEVRKEPGEIVIRQGDEGDNFYVVDEGECDVYVNIGGKPTKVLTCVKGQSFGELALMYNAPRAATVIPSTPAVLWAVDRITFKLILMDTTIKQRNLYEGFLENVPILANMSRYERLTLADALTRVEFSAGQDIIRQGETGDTFYIIEEGEVACSQTPAPGKPPEVVGRLKAGAYFGEIALLTNKPRAATVTAVQDTVCLTLTRVTFTRAMGPLQNILKRNIAAYKSYVSLI